MKFVNVGFNNMVNAERVVAVISSESAPAKRLIQDAKDQGRAVDCTSGRKTRCVVLMSKTHQYECPGGSLCSPTRREEGWQDPGRQTTSQPSVPLALSSPGAPASCSTHMS